MRELADNELIKDFALKKRFQAGMAPAPADFYHLIDIASSACQALGITSIPVTSGASPGRGSGLIYNPQGRLSVALGKGLMLDSHGKVTFDPDVEKAIRDDQTAKINGPSEKTPGYVVQAMFAAVRAGTLLLTPSSPDTQLGQATVDTTSGISINILREGIEFTRPQRSMKFVKLHENNWRYDHTATLSATDSIHFMDNGTFVPLTTLQVFGDSGAYLCFGSGKTGMLTSGAVIVVLYEGRLAAAGHWQLGRNPLAMDLANWVNYLAP